MSGGRDNVLVFWESPNGKDSWKPVVRDDIPEWLRDQELIDRMVSGEMVRNSTVEERWWKVTVVDSKPVLVGERKRNWVLIHQPGCGCPAFYFERRPKTGEEVRSADVIMPDGSLPKPGDHWLCGTCGQRMSSENMRTAKIMEVR